MQVILYKSLLVLFYIYLFLVLALNAVGLPGNWILVGTALIVTLIPKFGAVTWTWFLVCLGFAVLGGGLAQSGFLFPGGRAAQSERRIPVATKRNRPAEAPAR